MAEDSQPNEARILPKGASVPHIYSEKFRYTRAQHRSAKQTPNNISWNRPTDKRSEGQYTQHRPRWKCSEPNKRPSSINDGRMRHHSLHISSRTSRSDNGNEENRRHRHSSAAYTHERGAYYPCPAAGSSRMGGKRKAMLTLTVELPEHCRKGWKNARSNQTSFQKRMVNYLKENFGAIIHEYRVETDTILVTYSASEPIPASALTKLRYSEWGANESIQSSSSTRLEDLPSLGDRIDLALPTSSGPYDNVNKVVADMTYPLRLNPRNGKTETNVFTQPPRRIRSGKIILNYGTRDEYQRTHLPEPSGEATDASYSNSIDAPAISTSSGEDDDGRSSASQEGSVENILLLPESLPFNLAEESMHSREIVVLPAGDSGDRIRKLFICDQYHTIIIATMHGNVYSVERRLDRSQLHSSQGINRSIDDACVLSMGDHPSVVLADAIGEHPLSLLKLQKNFSFCVSPRNMSGPDARMYREAGMASIERKSSDNNRVRQGLSALTPLPTRASRISFISAGYDHIIQSWSLEDFTLPPSSRVLNTRHTSVVQSLLVVDEGSPKLISGGADCLVNIFDLEIEHTIHAIRTSNSVYQVHETNNPECILLEVGHRDAQFELHDNRIHTNRPLCRFGYESPKLQGRYSRGDVKSDTTVTFMSGSQDGHLRLWDLRNTSKVSQELICFPGTKITQALFDGNDAIVASLDNQLMIINTNLAQ